MLHTSKRSVILEQIHSAYASGADVKYINALLAEHDAAALEDENGSDVSIAHQISELSMWERLQREEVRLADVGRMLEMYASECANDSTPEIAIDTTDFTEVWSSEDISLEEVECLDFASFDDPITMVRETNAPPKQEVG